MLFTFYDDRLRDVPFLCVDGVVDSGLNLSHWPGNRSPSHLKADTSTEMALKLARDPGRAGWLKDVSIVTNNHFDTDGLLSVYAVLRPEQALNHEGVLLQAARTGDFGEFTTPEAFKFDAVVTGFEDESISPIADEIRERPERQRYQILYDTLLSALPDLLYETGRYKALWSDPLASLMRSMMRIGTAARVREHQGARLSVIEATGPLDRMARFNVVRHHRVLTATPRDGAWEYEMAFQIFSWFETVTPPRGSRIDLAAMARSFDEMETDEAGHWIYTGNDSLDARLYRAAPDGGPVSSTLPIDVVEGRLVRFFEGRP